MTTESEQVQNPEEQVTPPEEQIETPPKVEPTPPKVEKPTSEAGKEAKPLTQEQAEELVRRGKAEVQAAKDTELQVLKNKLAQIEAETSQKRGEQYLKEVEEAGGDVDMAKKLLAREQDLKKREDMWKDEKAIYDQTLASAATREKVYSATELTFKYELGEGGQQELMKANNRAEMESMAVKLAYDKLKGEREAGTPDKIDSGLTSAVGEDWRKLSSDEKIDKGLSKK